MHRFTKEELFNLWLQGDEKEATCQLLFDYVKTRISKDIDMPNEQQIYEKLRRLCRTFSDKWSKASRHEDRFRQKFSMWLNESFLIEIDEPTPSTSSGRPSLSFAEKSSRSQRREASLLAKEHEQESTLMLHAAGMAARKEGKRDLAAVVKEISRTPNRPKKIRKLFSSLNRNPIKYTAEEALELILDSNFSKQQYLDIRHGGISRNCDIYPDYKEVWKVKAECRPDGIIVSDAVAEVSLNDLLQHTTKRIITLQEEIILQHMNSINADEISAEIIFSSGFDGSSGHSMYKQKSDITHTYSDTSLFATTVIPLRLQTHNKIILWNNRTPQSVRFCRPLKLEFIKESTEHILKEKQNIDKQIEDLQELQITLLNGKVIKIKYTMFMTLIDGKVLNVLTGTKSSQACPICGATPSNFLKIEDFKTSKVFTPKANSLQYGLSPLHAWIRFFECIIHISYRIELEQWQMRGPKNKEIFNNRKKSIQERFLTQLHLHVDKPKASGFGSTNDGNTARRAFQDTKLFSNITDVDEDLIKRFQIILICLSCQYEINSTKFQEYCHSTATLYMSKYSWYPMPATVHKILVHGWQIIENTVLPIGCFGEEGSEARNKLYKYDRLYHARKTSRQHNLEDMFNRAMDTSDPIISSINLDKRISRQRKLNLPSEVVEMLKQPQLESDETEQNIEEQEVIETEEHSETILEEIFPVTQLDEIELDCDI